MENCSHHKKLSVRFFKFLLIFLLIIPSSFLMASTVTSQPAVREFINRVAVKYNYNPNYVRHILEQARYVPEVITKMNSPYEALPWYQYKALFVTQERVDNGLNYWNHTSKLVRWEEKEYEIPGNIVLAIIGIESKYGTQMGNFRVLDALTTLAFYYPERAKFFQKELANFIAMSNTYHFNPTTIMGSYAGAMGQCQFMPSSYLYYAVDFRNDRTPDLFTNKADVIFSVGNYLRQNGWNEQDPIAVPATIHGTAFKEILKTDKDHPTPPTMTLSQLASYNVTPATTAAYNPNLKASLIQFQGQNGPDYWLIFKNFYVITTYNSSYQYAMAVYQLAQHLQQAWNSSQKNLANNTNTEN